MAAWPKQLAPALSPAKVKELIASLDLPEPTSVDTPKVAAAFHSIYLVHFAPEDANKVLPNKINQRQDDGPPTLVLRISYDYLPRIKTLNEVAVMQWVREHTTIPVPAVVRFDASADNPAGAEFTLLERMRGTSADRVYGALGAAAKRRLVEQLVDVVAQLHAKSWDFVGGLTLGEDGAVVPGPVLEETFWMGADLARCWPSETAETLNIAGPYPSYGAYLAAHMGRYIYAINRHESLAWLRDLVPRLERFAEVVPTRKELDGFRLVLAHKDLHMANVMCDSATLELTAVLDWEFSGVVPAPRWDPVRAFLWNGQDDDESAAEKTRTRDLAEEIAREKGLDVFQGLEQTPESDPIQTVVNFVRGLVEVCPRGQAQENVGAWREVVEQNLSKMSV